MDTHILRITQTLVAVPYFFFSRRFARLQVRGEENIREAEKICRDYSCGVVFAANHPGDADAVLIAGGLREMATPLWPIYAVSAEHKHYRDFGPLRKCIYRPWLFKMLGAIPAVYGYHDYSLSLAPHLTLLEKGESVCIFPEGRMTKREDQDVENAKGGVGYLALETRACVVPITITGTSKMSIKSFFMKEHFFRIEYGKPLSPPEIESFFDTKDPAESYKRVAREIMSRVYAAQGR